MLHWSIEQKKLNLKYSWKISRNESTYKVNFFITVKNGNYTGTGEVAPNIRYNETPESIQEEFQLFLSHQPEKIKTAEELLLILKTLNICNALSFGIESAYTHMQSQAEGKAVHIILGLARPDKISTTYTLPIMEAGEIKNFIQTHRLDRFKTLKIKINKDNGLELISEVMRHSPKPLKIDANESWEDVDALITTMEKVKFYPIEFFEQPMPGKMTEEYKYLKKKTYFELIADESVTNKSDFGSISEQFHGINMKLMKAGSYRNGIKILNEAKSLGMKTMIGCMVETTLGISSAMQLCHTINYIDLDGFFVIENEPFKLVSEMEGDLYFK